MERAVQVIKQNFILYICVIFITSACDSGFLNNGGLGNIVVENSISLSVAKGGLTMNDLLGKVKPNDDVTFQYSTNGISILYNKSEPFSYSIDELLKPQSFSFSKSINLNDNIPGAFNPIPFDFNLDDIRLDFSSNLVLDNNEELDSAIIKSGMLNIDVTNMRKIGMDVDLIIHSIFVDGEKMIIPISLRDLESNSIVFNLNGASINFNTEEENKSKLDFSVIFKNIDLEKGMLITDQHSVDFDLKITDLTVSSVHGDLGDRVFDIKKYEYTFDDYLGNLEIQNIHFGSPRITMNVKNSFGLDLLVNFDSVFSSNSNTRKEISGKLKEDGLSIDGAFMPGQVQQSTIEISNKNSNLFELIEILPNRFFFDLSVSNDKMSDNISNFITDSSFIEIDPILELPLDLSLEKLAYEDTISVNISKILDKDEKLNIKKIVLEIQSKNTLPLDFKIDHVIFLDDNMVALDSLRAESEDIKFFKGASVDENGFSLKAETYKSKYILPHQLIYDIEKVKYIKYKASVNTTSSGDASQPLVKIRQADKVDLVFGVHVLVNSEFNL